LELLTGHAPFVIVPALSYVGRTPQKFGVSPWHGLVAESGPSLFAAANLTSHFEVVFGQSSVKSFIAVACHSPAVVGSV